MGQHSIRCDLPGSVCYMHVDEGARVEAGDPVIAVECMKQEHSIVADVAGIVRFKVALGEMVEQDQVLAEIERE